VDSDKAHTVRCPQPRWNGPTHSQTHSLEKNPFYGVGRGSVHQDILCFNTVAQVHKRPDIVRIHFGLLTVERLPVSTQTPVVRYYSTYSQLPSVCGRLIISKLKTYLYRDGTKLFPGFGKKKKQAMVFFILRNLSLGTNEQNSMHSAYHGPKLKRLVCNQSISETNAL
jgi:hypothetical protein